MDVEHSLLVLNNNLHLYLGCVYHHFSGVEIELRFPNDFQGDFIQMINAKLFWLGG